MNQLDDFLSVIHWLCECLVSPCTIFNYGHSAFNSVITPWKNFLPLSEWRKLGLQRLEKCLVPTWLVRLVCKEYSDMWRFNDIENFSHRQIVLNRFSVSYQLFWIANCQNIKSFHPSILSGGLLESWYRVLDLFQKGIVRFFAMT